MSDHEILDVIETLSEEIVLADRNDPQAMANLHGKIKEIGELCKSTFDPLVYKATEAAADLLENFIFGDVDDMDAAFNAVCQTITALQEIIRDGRPIDKVEFPELLNLSPAESQPEPGEAPAGETAESAPEQQTQPEPAAPDTAPADQPVAVEDEPMDMEPKPLEADPGLLADFVTEAMEHLDASDGHLLTLETTPQDEEALNAVFRAFHTIKGVAGFLALDQLGHLAHEAETLLDKCRQHEIELIGNAIDVTFDSVDMLKSMVMTIKDCLESGDPLPPKAGVPGLVQRIQDVYQGKVVEDSAEDEPVPGRMLGEILVDSGKVSDQDIDTALREQAKSGDEGPKLGEILIKEKKASPKDVAQALRAQQKAKTIKVREQVKVDSERLDRLVETIGELVIAESMVSQSNELEGIMSTNLARQVNQLNKITRELQEMGTTLRMVPISGVFQKMARLVRDLAKKSGKKIKFTTVGDETELDKTVVDQIGDPLVHLVRNAVDHGIEADAAARVAAGKTEAGNIELRAFHKGGNIYIEIEDDGGGIDKDAVIAKAVKQGLIREGDQISDREAYNLILRPGFSTAKQVTDISGRGVGMDVVKRNIEALRGMIEIQSERGAGSTFTIRLPLTLAVIDGMVVRVKDERYIIPTLSITRSLRPKSEEAESILKQGEMLSLDEGLVPLIRLSNLFEEDTESAEDLTDALVVIVETDGKKAGFVVNELLGQQQIVIKSLGQALQGINGISGGAIMPDGRVGLILDVGGLVKLANHEAENVGHA